MTSAADPIQVIEITDQRDAGQDEKSANFNFDSSPTATNNSAGFEIQSSSESPSMYLPKGIQESPKNKTVIPPRPRSFRNLLRWLVKWNRRSNDDTGDEDALEGVRQCKTSRTKPHRTTCLFN